MGAMMTSETITVSTKQCVVCKKYDRLKISRAGFIKYTHGMFIQEAFPELSDTIREQLINGTHPECQDVIDEYADAVSTETYSN